MKRRIKNKTFKEWLSIQIVKNPSRVILVGIILVNMIFIVLSASIISFLTPFGGDERGFLESLFYTISMVMDAGCVSYIVEDVGSTNANIIILCVIIVLVGMVFFTGGIIGYVSTQIASFIDNSNAGKRPLLISDHTIILNWNNRASEVINDLLYSEYPETVVVLVPEEKAGVELEIENRLSDTLTKENKIILDQCSDMRRMEAFWYYRKNRMKRRLTVIVREGEPFSQKQLMDISVDKAKAVIILNRGKINHLSRNAMEKPARAKEGGNSVTVKTLALVAELTSAESSLDNQKIIVEVEDQRTANIIQKIIRNKEKIDKCNIVPIEVNRILGQLLAQFSIMPELNLVYSELFSNKGAEFYSQPFNIGIENRDNCLAYLKTHSHAVPLISMETKSGQQFFYLAEKEDDLRLTGEIPEIRADLKLNPDLWQPRRNILIMGHNSKINGLMAGFKSYGGEWNPAKDGRDILNIHIIDDKAGLEKNDHYRAFPYVNKVVEADLFDEETIYSTINSFIDEQDGDTGILILSDDNVGNEDLDAGALTYLIYVQDIIAGRRELNKGKDSEQIDVIIEILNPKNYDVVVSYSVDNVVISNRYISKMITQIGEKDALFEFYNDILTYDQEGSEVYQSMELYIKRVGDVFLELPGPCSAADLIRDLYLKGKRSDQESHTLAIGYITDEGKMVIFSGNQTEIMTDLSENDKLILFSNH